MQGYSKKMLMDTMLDFAGAGAGVIYWFSEQNRLDWLHQTEDVEDANGMFGSIGVAVTVGLYQKVTAPEPFTLPGNQTFFPVLVHQLDQSQINPAHFLLTQTGVAATPYYFRTAELREQALALMRPH